MCGVPRVSADHMTARREQILAAARTCFLRNGLHTTSMQDLIREANLSVGAVYRYFRSKNEIINAIAEDVAGALGTRLQAIADRELPLGDALGLVLDAVDEQARPGGNFPLALQIWAEAMIDPAIRDIVRLRYAAMRSAFEVLAKTAVRQGELPADADVEAVAAALFGMMPGYGLQRLIIGTPDHATYLAGIRALLAR